MVLEPQSVPVESCQEGANGGGWWRCLVGHGGGWLVAERAFCSPPGCASQPATAQEGPGARGLWLHQEVRSRGEFPQGG